MRLFTLIAACAALAAGAVPAFARPGPPAPPATIIASVGHSEWCRTGTVRLNLATGRYLVRAPSTWLRCRRPPWPRAVSTGLLNAGDLAAVREAAHRAEADGLADWTCGYNGQTQRVVISNGGMAVLRVTQRGRTVAPPANAGCWSEAALQLHSLLQRLFDPRPAHRG